MAARRNRILFVNHVSKVLGGAEINLLELLATPAAAAAWELHVACAPESPLDLALSRLNVTLTRHPHAFAPALNELRVVGRRFNPAAKIRGWREVRRGSERLAGLLQAVRPDAVVSCTNKDHFAAGAASHAAQIPSIWWINDVISADFFPWPVRKLFALRARQWAKRLAPVSDYCRSALIREGVPPDRCVTVHNGIPLDHYRRPESPAGSTRSPESGPVIGIAGRITAWKGQRLFLEIAADWVRRGRPGRFVILGRAFNEDAPFEAELRSFIEAQGLQDRVEFLAFQKDIAAALSAMDILLHCSTRPEPFGRVIIEAMAVGVPVIAAHAGGVPEIITDGIDGILVAPGDRKAYLDALERVTLDPDLRATLTANGRQTVARRFTVERVVADFVHVIQAAAAVESKDR